MQIMRLKRRLTMSNCILWTKSKNRFGYGNQWVDGKCQKAHRVAYKNYYGEFDKSLCVCHSCDNPSCINPLHLFLATHGDTKGEKNGQAKLCERSVKLIRQFLSQGIMGKEIAITYGISRAQVSRIKNNKKWKVTA